MKSRYLVPNGMAWVPHPYAETLSALEDEILATHPLAEFHFDPSDADDSWFLDVRYFGRCAVLEWSAGKYGVSDVSGMKGMEGYGNRPDISTPIYLDAKRHLLIVLHVEIPSSVLDTLRFYANPEYRLVLIKGEQRYVCVDNDFGDRARKCLGEIS
jgi:hypothetical protein